MTVPTHDDRNMIDLLTRQHREVDAIFEQLERMTSADSEDAERLARQAVIHLVQHSVSEEVHLYPTTRRVLDDGDQVADHEIGEHDEAEATMKELESLHPGEEGFWPTVQQLIDQVRHHVEEEENRLFPRLREACTEDQLRALGEDIERTQKFAPTRPHPTAPSEGIPLQAAAPGAGMVDRLRDAVTGRGR